MVVGEMTLDGLEQFFVGAPCELRPALAVSNPTSSVDGRRHFADAPPRMS
jgi:hypothetical protein